MFISRSQTAKRQSSGRLRRRPRLELIEDRLAPAVVVGAVFNDLNGNGVRENTEPGMPGVTVFIDANGNGKFESPMLGVPGDPAAITGADGKYTIQTGLTGKFNVLQVVPAGFTQTTPPGAPVELTSNSTTAVNGPLFGNKLSSGGFVSGSVFLDSNNDGKRDLVEPPLAGVFVYLDLNNNGKFDAPVPGTTLAGEPGMTTGTQGKYEFKSANDGKYTVAITVPQGMTATTPISGSVEIAGGLSVPGPNFGLNKSAPPPPTGGTVHGVVFLDGNADGKLDSNDVGMPGVRVFIDLNNNGKLDGSNDPTIPGEPNTLTGNLGGYELKLAVDGTYSVVEIVPDGFVATTGVAGSVTLAGGALVAGPNFGNNKLPPPPPTGGVVRGVVFADTNGNGQFENAEMGMPGVLVYVDINNNGKFDAPVAGTTLIGEPAVLSGPNGSYEIKLAVDGTFTVTEVVPQGFVATTPTSGSVTIAGGAVGQGPAFGNNKAPIPGGLIRGVVFKDVNGNGKQDSNEPGLGGVRIFLDLNNNGKFDTPTAGSNMPGEPSVLSGNTGRYEIKANFDGKYTVAEIVPNGFVPTTPTSDEVMVAGGMPVAGPRFGLKPAPVINLGSVSGRVFFDANANGKIDFNEPGLPGVIVYDDANTNGKFDAGEKSTVSGNQGHYGLVLPIGQHSIRQVVPFGFVQTVSPGIVTIVAGQNFFGAHFGNRFVGVGSGNGGTNAMGMPIQLSPAPTSSTPKSLDIGQLPGDFDLLGVDGI